MVHTGEATVLLKASLLAVLCGLVGVKLPFSVSYPALWLLPIAEVVYMTVHHDDFDLGQLGVGYLILLSLSLTSFYCATISMLDHRQPSR